MRISNLNGRISKLEKAIIPDREPAVVVVCLKSDIDPSEREQRLADARREAGPDGTVVTVSSVDFLPPFTREVKPGRPEKLSHNATINNKEG